MTNHAVTLALDEGLFVPSVPSVPVAAGDTISIANSEGGPAYMILSPDARTLLSLKTQDAHVIPGGQTARFTFASSAPGAYWACFNSRADQDPPTIPNRLSTDFVLTVGVASEGGFMANSPGTGH